MQTPVCLNCENFTSAKVNEFCDTCLEELDTMVDHRDMSEINEVEIEANFNPFMESTRVTGGIKSQSKESIEARIEDESSTGFVMGLIAVGMLTLFMAYYYIYQ